MSNFDKIIQSHQGSFPVKAMPIARDLGVAVYSVSGWPNDISGMVKNNPDNGYEIYVNKDHPENRRRFTIAHEIGHCVLHKDLIGDGIVDDGLYRSSLSKSIEREANQFAADLLMPWHLINLAMSDEYNNITALAKAFEVSEHAMSIRLGVPIG